MFELGSNPTKRHWGLFALNMIFNAIIYFIFLAAMYFVSKMVLLGSISMKYEFLVIATAVSMLVQLGTSTGRLIKVLYYDVDNELLLRFPIGGVELFLSKATFVYLNNLIISVVLTLPFYVYYGIFTGQGVGYYFGSVAVSMVISLIPFFLANLIAVPVMHLNNQMKNKFAFQLAAIIILIVASFSIYMVMLQGILKYYETQETASLFSTDVLLKIKSFASALAPASYYANILSGTKVFISVLITTGITILFGGVSLYMAGKFYYPTVLKSVEKGREAFTKKTKNRIRSQFATIMHTETTIIFRSFNYAFQYLAMAIAAPFMVYFCNNLAVAIGDSSVGGAIIPGLTMMVVLIFDTIIVSFASTTISRNGQCFYLTKIFPVSFKHQIAAKMALYFLVAGASSLVSCLTTWIIFGGEKYGNYIGVLDVLGIFSISSLVIISQTCIAILADLKSPSFDVNGEGELVQVNKNVSNSMILGIAISVIYGIIAMVFTYIPMGSLNMGIHGVYIVLTAVSLGIAAIVGLILYFRVDKLYDRLAG